MHATTFISRISRLCSASQRARARRWRLLLLLVVLLLVVVLPAPAWANFLVYPLTASIDAADEADTRISVYSKSGATQFIRVRVARVVDAATPDEREVMVEPADGTDLLVLPRRLVVPAGAIRGVRVLMQNPPETETIYRVYFESVSEFDDSKPASDDTTEAAVSFNIAFGATVRVMPAQKRASLSLAPSRDAIANTGNMRIGVMRIGRCVAGASAGGCEWTSIQRSVYPGATWPLPWHADQRRVVATIRTTDDPKERDVELP